MGAPETREAQRPTSWAVASATPGRYAAADAAHEAASAIMDLLNAARKRTVTIQWMPDDNGYGCRFEIIEVKTGDYLGIARIDADGHVTVA